MTELASTQMISMKGTPASPGIAVGKARLAGEGQVNVGRDEIQPSQRETEVVKYQESVEKAEQQLETLKQLHHDEEIGKIMSAQIQIIHDPELDKRVKNLVFEENKDATQAVFTAYNEYSGLLEGTGEGWASERSVDLQALRDRLIRLITGDHDTVLFQAGSVIFGEDLSPSDVIELHQANVAAIVMQHGGTTSHAVIISQSLGIPCVVGVNWKQEGIQEEMDVIVDGDTGEIVCNADRETQEHYLSRKEAESTRKEDDYQQSQAPNRTNCGSEFRIRANVEFTEEIPRLRHFGAEGIGLLRTETLFLRQGYFDLDRHITFYKTFLEETGDQPVVIRLLDVGGDKMPGVEILEANPFLGWRGIRMLLDEKKLLHRQIIAIYKAAETYPGRVSILAPMVSDLSELEALNREIEIALDSQKDFKAKERLPLGIMIEVPAIALQAAEAAQAADFFSIGSNDLIQYTLAADRGNERVSSLYRQSHPAVWRLIKMSFIAGQEADIPVHVCGEIAGNPLLAAALVGMGIQELSMHPASIPLVKKVLCNHSLEAFKELTDGITESANGNESEESIMHWKEKYIKM